MKTSTPKLSILIATVGSRTQSFLLLMSSLTRQIKRANLNIEVVALWNNGEKSIGDIRQKLLECARGEYVCFVDDDDTLSESYCDEIIKALGKDYVGFEVMMFNDGVQMPRVFHSIRYNNWSQDENGYYRGVTHLNPIKRSIALKGSFSGTAGEDERWSNAVRPYVTTENYIDKPMYYYYHVSGRTHFGSGKIPGGFISKKRPIIPKSMAPFFRWCEL